MDLAVPIVVSCLSLTIGGLAAMGETPVSAFKKVMSTVLAKATDGGGDSSSARNNSSTSRRNSSGNVQEAVRQPQPQPAAPAPSPPRPPPPAPPPPAPASNANKNSANKNSANKNSANKNARPDARNGASKDEERKAFVPYAVSPAKGDTAKQRNDMNESADDDTENAGRRPLW